MGFRKYQSVEKTEVVSPEGHDAIENELHKLGKHSAVKLDEDERKQVTDALDRADEDS